MCFPHFYLFLGYVLSGHALSTHQVYSLPDCDALCLEHPRCLSYNYQATSISSNHLCEINDATGKMCPQDMVKTTGYKYFEDKVNDLMSCCKKCICITKPLKALVTVRVSGLLKTCNACTQPVIHFRRERKVV